MIDSILHATFGGFLIGLSAILMFGLLGRIAGISGLFWNSLPPRLFKQTVSWQLAFLVGLISAPIILKGLGIWDYPDGKHTNIEILLLAGFLVGFGTKFGSGCTSGHGICGISRFSLRSVIATVTFMISGILSVALFH